MNECFEYIYGTTILACSECGLPIGEGAPAYVTESDAGEFIDARHYDCGDAIGPNPEDVLP